MAYSTGTLPEAFNLVIATHLSMCDDCRAAVAEYDALGGELLAEAGETELAEDSLEATLALIAAGSDRNKEVRRVPAGGSIPTPLMEYIGGDLDKVKWRKIGGGVSQMVLETSNDASVRLLKIPAGAKVPDHGHTGTEITLVLKGAFSDDEDHFAPGDVEVANENLTHTPVADDGEDCICLAATDAPLVFKGLIPRVAQKFIGI